MLMMENILKTINIDVVHFDRGSVTSSIGNN